MLALRKIFAGAIFGGLLLGFAAPAAAAPTDLLRSRAYVLFAGAKCRSFTEAELTALQAGERSALNALLLGNMPRGDVLEAESRAQRQAQQADCQDPALQTEVQRARDAYRGFVRTGQTTFAGGGGRTWFGDRTGVARIRWRLSQSAAVGAGEAHLGLSGKLGATVMTAVIETPGEAPYAAQIVLRDPKLWTTPVIGRQLPAGTARVIPAAQRGAASAELTLRKAEAGLQQVQFAFPADAVRAICALDPREDIEVEFVFQTEVRRARFPVGDFMPGALFISLPVQ